MDTLRQMALSQVRDGAAVLDVNVGMGGVDEAALMGKAVCELATLTPAPLCIDTSDPTVAEAALTDLSRQGAAQFHLPGTRPGR